MASHNERIAGLDFAARDLMQLDGFGLVAGFDGLNTYLPEWRTALVNQGRGMTAFGDALDQVRQWARTWTSLTPLERSGWLTMGCPKLAS